jgi:acyl CoA:acetate/3-ketoacid CoA transferase beta subunit
VLEPDPETKQLVLTQLHPGVSVEQVQEATGWDLQIADGLRVTEPPTDEELASLRELLSR